MHASRDLLRSLLITLLAAMALPGVSTAAQNVATPDASDQGYWGADEGAVYGGDFTDLAAEIDQYWEQEFRAAGVDYTSPVMYTVEQHVVTRCGTEITPDRPNAYYCSLDRTVYLVPSFLLAQNDDFVPVSILAHEWGHHIQALLSVRGDSEVMELQADCLMGAFTRHVDESGLLESGDLFAALEAAERYGDKEIHPAGHPGAHGLPTQRMKWLIFGYSYEVAGCNLPFEPIVSDDGPWSAPPDPQSFLPETPPLSPEACFRTEQEPPLSFEQILERFPDSDEAAVRLRGWDWQGSDHRVFACDDPPVGGAGWIEMTVHLFGTAASAQQAVDYFAMTHAEGTGLVPEVAPEIGEHAAALSGPAYNGTEYTLYASQGPVLIRVTGISPSGIPSGDVMAVAQSMLGTGQGSPQPEPAPALALPASGYLPHYLTVDHARCFSVFTLGIYNDRDVAAALEALGLTGPQIESLGWAEGAYIVLRCDAPPAGRASQVDVVIHRFGDAASAQEAEPYVDATYEPGDNEARDCDSVDALVVCVLGQSPSGKPVSDVQRVLAQVVSAAG